MYEQQTPTFYFIHLAWMKLGEIKTYLFLIVEIQDFI